VNTDLDNVRADVTLTGGTGSADNAYLLVWDGLSTFEIIKGGFFAKYTGNTIEGDNGLNQVSSLTFGATAPGTYIVKIAINKVNGTTGAVEARLAEQTLTFTVTVPTIGIATTGFESLTAVTLPEGGLQGIKDGPGVQQLGGGG
jgi:hypothetical protein